LGWLKEIDGAGGSEAEIEGAGNGDAEDDAGR